MTATPAVPQPTVQPTGYVVSCLPEGHDDRWTFTVQVKHTGHGLFAVRHGIRQYGSDGTWAYEPDFDEDDEAEAAWAKEHRFDHDTALRLAKELAPTLTCRGRSVADVLIEGSRVEGPDPCSGCRHVPCGQCADVVGLVR